MNHKERVVAAFLALLTGINWEPRFDQHGRVYMWLKPKDSR